MPVNKQQFGTPFNKTASGTLSAVATQTAGTFVQTWITDISGSSDATEATMIVQEGATVIWKEYIKNTTPYHISFQNPITGGQRGTLTTVTVNGTLVSYANMSGFQLAP